MPHAPEPWHTSGTDVCDASDWTIVRTASGRRGRTDLEWCLEDNANRDRIVACVNACAGIADPADAIAKSRDALATWIRQLDAIGRDGIFPDAARLARAALAALGKPA